PAVARIALARASSARINSDDQCGETGLVGTVDGRLRGLAAADEIELIPCRPLCRGFDVLQFMAGNSRQEITRSSIAGSAGGGNLTPSLHQPAVPDRGE